MIEEKLKSLLKGEFSSLSIEYNDHASCYVTAREADEHGELEYGTWVSDDEKAKALESNSVWRLQYYPDTPVGSYVILASTLEACMKCAFE